MIVKLFSEFLFVNLIRLEKVRMRGGKVSTNHQQYNANGIDSKKKRPEQNNFFFSGIARSQFPFYENHYDSLTGNTLERERDICKYLC